MDDRADAREALEGLIIQIKERRVPAGLKIKENRRENREKEGIRS